MTREEFYDWKRHPVTQEIFALMESEARDAVEHMIIASTLGNHDIAQRYAMKIQAYRDVLKVDFEEAHGN